MTVQYKIKLTTRYYVIMLSIMVRTRQYYDQNHDSTTSVSHHYHGQYRAHAVSAGTAFLVVIVGVLHRVSVGFCVILVGVLPACVC